MTRRLAVAVLLLVAGCGADRGVTVDTGVPAAQPPQTTTTTTVVTVPPPTTTTTSPATTTTAGRDPSMPNGAHHGDQKEVVDHFAEIDGTTDCDQLRAERAARQAERDQMLATRAETGHRARAEMDDRYAEAARQQLSEAGCTAMAVTE